MTPCKSPCDSPYHESACRALSRLPFFGSKGWVGSAHDEGAPGLGPLAVEFDMCDRKRQGDGHGNGAKTFKLWAPTENLFAP